MKVLLSGIVILVALGGCGTKTSANYENFANGMSSYLEQGGHLCLGKYTWPIDLTRNDFELATRDAVQLPVLEKRGLVSSSDAIAEDGAKQGTSSVKIRRYELTTEGQRYYREVRDRGVERGRESRRGDLCIARLSLDKVVGWETSVPSDGGKETVVTYTYRVDAQPWLSEPEFARAFPVIARVVQGAGTWQMKESFVLSDHRWVAKDLLQ